MSYTDKQHQQIAEQQYKDLDVGQQVYIDNDLFQKGSK